MASMATDTLKGRQIMVEGNDEMFLPAIGAILESDRERCARG